MKRIFALLVAVMLLCSVSCTPNEPVNEDLDAGVATTTTTTSAQPGAAAAGSQQATTTTGADDPSGTTTTTSAPTSTTTTTTPAKATTTTTAKKPATTTTTKKPTTTTTTTTTITTTTQPQVDGAEVAALVAKYINENRNTPATVLPGLGKVATYRANQLITNFAHDTADSREALAYYQYGEYVDPADYGDPDGVGYYRGYNREAIGKGRWTGTADEIARGMAATCQASTKHWAYVGSDEYGYMAVGVAYDPSCYTWYCCICMTAKDYGG